MPFTNQHLIYKFIATTLESAFETDVLSLLNCNCHTDNTPIIQSLLKVWQNGQPVDVPIDVWYAFQRDMVICMRSFVGNPLVDCLRVAVADELCDAHIYMDLSEKISLYAAFVYSILHDDDTVKSLVEYVDKNIGYPEDLCLRTKETVRSALEGTTTNG